jgi:superfamily II DNA or RNA helicase
MSKVRILIGNHRSRIVGDLKVVVKLSRALRLKSPGYFFSQAWRDRVWDGYINYVTETGTFMTGVIYQVIEKLDEWEVKYTLEDSRETFRPKHSITELGGLEMRDYQLDAVTAFMDHKLKGIPFRRGILHEATNAGKNLIAAAIFASFSDKRKGIFLIDNATIYEQALRELAQLLPGEVGRFDSRKIDMTKRVTVCMVQTLATRAKKFPKIKRWLSSQDIFIADECDTVGTRKDTKYVAQNCHTASVRLGMSGTPLHHKDKTRNQEVINFFGKVLHVTSNKELVDKGHSSKPTIRFVKGNTTVTCKGDYQKEYRLGIIKNKKRNKKIWRITQKALKKGPVVILFKYHDHLKYLIKQIPFQLSNQYSWESVHHKTPGRTQILQKFNKGKIDVLIASMIIRRGMNLKLMRSLINAAGGDSHSNIVQLFGRGLRKEEGVKEEIDIWEFFDTGRYLQRHSKHRIRYYKQEDFPVKELYK